MALVELPGFEERVRRHKWTGNRLPALYTGDRQCVACSSGRTIRVGPYTQHALFRDAGYGAGTRTTIDVCFECGRSSIATSETVAPPRRNKK